MSKHILNILITKANNFIRINILIQLHCLNSQWRKSKMTFDSSRNRNAKERSNLIRSIMIWGIGDIYFMISVVIAILFGMLSADLQQHLHLSASQLGISGSVFFLCYGLAQLVGGCLMDSWGPRLTLTISALITSLGLFIFAKSASFSQVLIAQTLSGIGLSTSYIGAIFLAGSWFSANRFPLISGITQMSANLMTVIAVAVMVYYGALSLGFQIIMEYLAIIVFLIAIGLLLVVRKAPLAEQATITNTNAGLWSDLKLLLGIRQFWLGTLYFSTAFGALLAFSNLWNTPDQISYGHSIQTASLMTTMLPLGGALGAVLSGLLSSLTQRISSVARFYSAGMFIVCVILLYGPILSSLVTFFMLMLLGFFFGGAVLGFPLVSQHIPNVLRGTGFGMMATVAYLLSSLLQYLIGALLGANVSLHGGIAIIHDFKIALIPLVITLGIGFIGSLWLKDAKPALAH